MPAPGRAPRAWPRVLGTGALLWVLSVVVTFLTGNTTLLPTVVLLGSFLVPVTFVAWAFEHLRGNTVTLYLVARAFLVGGLLGVLAASLVESYLLAPTVWLYLGVGLVEELAKLLALMLVTRRAFAGGGAERTLADGLLLGAAVGFGFAALETSGYAFNAMLTMRGLSLGQLVETEILRGVLAPVGHGLWTAILGGVVFAASRGGRLRLTGGVVLAYLGVSLLHALWDAMHGIAVVLTVVLTGTAWQYQLFQLGYVVAPTPLQAHLFTLINWVGLALVALLGLAWLARLRERLPRTSPAPGQTPPGPAAGPAPPGPLGPPPNPLGPPA
ncbi:Membrane proteinase PrsW, cleaves anti-sigma factor RsiW, M82 family [Goodfellowiella coeruleoviolacea]|uniref:Membrane proteinase PrsW, cleaves anti-sigma factor RsiW, M82 family n=1 Tax=Goodfellowiella coeruleoviolacea TaxID=334858 RepID=A0AAE3KHH5_9PSEU|nr:Membrane proteinase PrsW, cleaves anti-sigma factor RsiW, M82 family [Goodfellowiella coeruleoviolacea]